MLLELPDARVSSDEDTDDYAVSCSELSRYEFMGSNLSKEISAVQTVEEMDIIEITQLAAPKLLLRA
jgi:hypothetical protein